MVGARRKLLALLRIPLLERVRAAAEASGQPLYLTGGWLRDLLHGRTPQGELDLTLPEPSLLLRKLRRERGESAFLMDEERETYRLVLPEGSGITALDLTRLRAPAIEEDLRLRDFTINALALDLRAGNGEIRIIDSTGGLADLAAGRIRACSPDTFRADPLRSLRGVRFAGHLNFTIEARTLKQIRSARKALATVSAERIRDEVFRILGGQAPAEGLRRILELGLLGFLGPPFRSSQRPSLVVLRRSILLLGDFPRRSHLRRILDESPEQGVSRRSLLLLAAFLKDRNAASSAAVLCERLVLGKKAARLLKTALSTSLPEGWHKQPAKRRALLELFHRADAAIEETVLLHAVLLRPARLRREAAERFLRRYRRARRLFRRPSLLTGTVALEHLAFGPGPELGKLLERARRAQDLGAYHDLAGALKWARNHLSP